MSKDYLKVLAPCGLNCEKCLAFAEGNIKKLSVELKDAFGNFDSYAERFSKFAPVFGKYPEFKEFLEFLTQAKCGGCRTDSCSNKSCKIPKCIKEKRLEFCYQCPDFPCESPSFDETLNKKWLDNNKLIQEIGIEKFLEKSQKESRYK